MTRCAGPGHRCTIGQVIDPSWSSLNLSRLDGADNGQALQALEDARTLLRHGRTAGAAAAQSVLQ